MFRTNANTIMGERACTALELFRRGCATMRRTPAEMSSSEKIYGISSHNEGGLPRERSRRGKANSKSASALLLELQEHVKGKCHLTHGLEGRFLLTQTQSAQARPQCRWRPGAQSGETAPWDSCTTPLLFSPSRSPYTSSRSRRCLLRPAPHVEGVVQARKKKCGFMV